MRQARYRYTDWMYDTTAQDWQVSAGDLVVSYDADTLFKQMLIDAMESSFNSMPHVLRNWGFEGRAVDYSIATDVEKNKVSLFIEEIIGSLAPFIRNVIDASIAFPSGSNSFTLTFVFVLADISRTTSSGTLTWDGATKRATIV